MSRWSIALPGNGEGDNNAVAGRSFAAADRRCTGKAGACDPRATACGGKLHVVDPGCPRDRVPVRASEQYPKGLGPTVPELMELLQPSELMEKVHFSCSAEESCREAILETGRDQIIVAGVEAHVCVLQTVLDLVELGKSLFVVADAVSSRDPRNAELAVARMRQAGVQAVSCEMVLFEWAHKAGTDQFRRLSKTFLR